MPSFSAVTASLRQTMRAQTTIRIRSHVRSLSILTQGSKWLPTAQKVLKDGSGNFNAPLAVYHAAAYQQEIEVDDDKPTELQALKALDDPAPKETAKWPIADLRIVQPYVYLAVPRKYTENSAVYVIEPKHFNSSKDWDPEMMERNRIMLRRWASNQRILTLREMGDDDQFKNLYMGLLEEERAQIPEQIVEQYIDDYASGEETDGIDEGEYTPFYPREIEALEKAMAQELDTTGDIKMEIKTTESDEEVPNKESMDKDDRLKDRSVYLHEQDTGLADFDDKRYRLLHIWDVDDQLRREHTTRVYLPDSEAEQEAEEEEAERQEYLRGEKWVRRRNRRIDAGLDPSSSSDGLTSEESASESEEELEYMNPERPEMMPQPQYMPVGIEYLGVEQNMVDHKEIKAIPKYHRNTTRSPTTIYTLVSDLRLVARRLALNKYTALTPDNAVYQGTHDEMDPQQCLAPLDQLKLHQKTLDIVLTHGKSMDILKDPGMGEYATRTAAKALCFLGHGDDAVNVCEKAIKDNPALMSRVWDVYLLSLIKSAQQSAMADEYITAYDYARYSSAESASDTEAKDQSEDSDADASKSESQSDGDKAAADTPSRTNEVAYLVTRTKSVETPLKFQRVYEFIKRVEKEMKKSDGQVRSSMRVKELPALLMGNLSHLMPFAMVQARRDERKRAQRRSEHEHGDDIDHYSNTDPPYIEGLDSLVQSIYTLARGSPPEPATLTFLLSELRDVITCMPKELSDEHREHDERRLLTIGTRVWAEHDKTLDNGWFTTGNFIALNHLLDSLERPANVGADLWSRFLKTEDRVDDVYVGYEKNKFLQRLIERCDYFDDVDTAKSIAQFVLDNENFSRENQPTFWETFFSMCKEAEMSAMDMTRMYALSLPSVLHRVTSGRITPVSREKHQRHRKNTYLYLMQKAVADRDPLTAMRIYNDIGRHGYRQKQCHHDLLLEACVNPRIKREPSDNSDTVDQREQLVAETIYAQHALAVYNKVDFVPTWDNLTLVLKALCNTGQFERALDVFAKSANDCDKPMTPKFVLGFMTMIKNAPMLNDVKKKDMYLGLLAEKAVIMARGWQYYAGFDIPANFENQIVSLLNSQVARTEVQRMFKTHYDTWDDDTMRQSRTEMNDFLQMELDETREADDRSQEWTVPDGEGQGTSSDDNTRSEDDRQDDQYNSKKLGSIGGNVVDEEIANSSDGKEVSNSERSSRSSSSGTSSSSSESESPKY